MTGFSSVGLCSLASDGNQVLHHNKYCVKTARLPFVQGSGILLAGDA
ncbi:hypothetical protein ACGFZQ_45420 [Streptomyces sp. NPDC048254]